MSSLPADSGQRFTYADYLTWPQEERWELIEGVPFAMTPAPATSHQRLAFELGRQLGYGLLGRPCEAFGAPMDVLLPEGDETQEQVETVVQPDLFVVCDPARGKPRGVRGAPDFIIEIVSPSTGVRDEIVKAALYERHGVREYWTIHPAERLITIRLLGSDGKFAPHRFVEAKGTLPVTVLEGFEFDLSLAFARLVPEG